MRRERNSLSPVESDFFWNNQNRLPTPAPSDSSRNTSPQSTDRRARELSTKASTSSLERPYNDVLVVAEATLSSADKFSSFSHEIDLTAPPSDRTNAFFSSHSTSYKLPTPPQRSLTLSHHDSTASDRSVTLSRSASDPHGPTSRSKADIFFASGSGPPSPPPPLPPSSPPAKDTKNASPNLPPLSRFFPSRYRRNSQDVVEEFPVQISPESDSFPSSVKAPSTFQSTAILSPIPHPARSEFSNPPIHSTHPHTIPRESLPPQTLNDPVVGQELEADDLRLTLLRHIGLGAFSTVWLARENGNTLHLSSHYDRRPSESIARRRRDRKMDGFRPSNRVQSPGASNILSYSLTPRQDPLEIGNSESMLEADSPRGRTHDVISSDSQTDAEKPIEGRVVAIKMMELTMCAANDRTRISFVREVEVLRHISHPNIVSYIHSFTTPTHHCLVLEFLAGGELFELLNTDENHAKMTESLLRRIWGELTLAIGWMHEVALVHRDIKLENILLTCNPFVLDVSSSASVVTLPSPLIKITDFGLARFIDPANPLLTTRCGSEYYAAPEIIMGKPYDGRQTDAWAAGVVLYALATRFLPFDRSAYLHSSPDPSSTSSPSTKETKRSYLMRIAKGEYHWPGIPSSPAPSSSNSTWTGEWSSSSSTASSSAPPSRRSSFASYSDAAVPPPTTAAAHWSPSPSQSGEVVESEAMPSVSASRLATEGVRRMVGRLLVRDPSKRARMIDLWDDEWMRGPGAPFAPPEANPFLDEYAEKGVEGEGVLGVRGVRISMEQRRKSFSESGRLVEAHSIPNVAWQDATA